MFVCLASMMFAACSPSRDRPPLAVTLPPPPNIGPVTPPPIREGASPKALAAAYIVALDGANQRIMNWRAWYDALRAGYAAGEFPTAGGGGE